MEGRKMAHVFMRQKQGAEQMTSVGSYSMGWSKDRHVLGMLKWRERMRL